MNLEQESILLQYLEEFLTEPAIENAGSLEDYNDFDQKRADAVPILRKLLDDFISGEISLKEFKELHELKSREYPYWGFGGFSGQMQLNQFANNIDDTDKGVVFKSSVQIPSSEVEAKKKIDLLVKFISEKRAVSDKRQSLPRPASMKYVLTYFWEIQNQMRWPVYYNSSRKILESVGLLKSELSEGDSYLDFLKVMQDVLKLYKSKVKDREVKYPFWFVEHVLWRQFISTNNATGTPTAKEIGKTKPTEAKPKKNNTSLISEVANEWLPPVIADLNELAHNRETSWSRRNSQKPEKALETKVRIAFTLMGYEAVELGQGTGRQPDGFAISLNGSDGDYAVVYDAKAREDGFSVGTADREMNEYIRKKGEELRRRRVSRFYFLIVSSDFDESPKSLSRIKDVFRLTRVPIVMLKAADLLFLIEEKLKDTDLTHDRLEQLFLETGILTREKIIEILGIR